MYTFRKLHDRRIPEVRVGVGVGSMEFKLNGRVYSRQSDNTRCHLNVLVKLPRYFYRAGAVLAPPLSGENIGGAWVFEGGWSP